MILLRILDHDLHRARGGGVPLDVFVPALPSFVPGIVSDPFGKFCVMRKLTKDRMMRSWAFPYDSDKLDGVLGPMFQAALDLSLSEGWPNVFRGPRAKAVPAAYKYVQDNSGLKSQPHVCLFPSTWEPAEFGRAFGKGASDNRKFRKSCRLVPAPVPAAVFLSRPDLVGMYTQFMSTPVAGPDGTPERTAGRASIVLHNVRLGLGFAI